MNSVAAAGVLTHALRDGDGITVAGLNLGFSVLDVGGHTLGHIAYFGKVEGDNVLFCGDTLFAAGCGRIFEGTPQQMFASLSRIAALPADQSPRHHLLRAETRCPSPDYSRDTYCGHACIHSGGRPRTPVRRPRHSAPATYCTSTTRRSMPGGARQSGACVPSRRCLMNSPG